VTFRYDGRKLTAPAGSTIAAALLRSDIPAWRRTRRRDDSRGLFCGIGHCHDCLVDVNEDAAVRACQVVVRDQDDVRPSRSVGRPDEVLRPARMRPEERPGGAEASGRIRTEVAVVGAGPGGMAAALAAADAGCRVTLIDSAPRAGGQIYRQSQQPGDAGADAPAASRLPGRLGRVTEHPGITLAAGVSVWHAEQAGPGFRLHCTGNAEMVEAQVVVLATGASELVVPFPGWTLPGVVTAGAAQAMLKAQRTLVGRRVLVAGTGPLLLPVAAGLARGGARVAALCEAAGAGRALARLPAMTRHPGKLAEAAGYGAALARGRIPVRSGWALTACRGRERVEEALVSRVGPGWEARGPARVLAVDAVAVSHGLVPLLDLSRALGCRDEQQAGYPAAAVVVGTAQETSAPGVFACGEVTGVGGAAQAEPEGTVAGAAAARHLGRLDEAGFRARTADAARRARHARDFAALLRRLYPLAGGWLARLQPDTVICRCEDVTWSEVAGAVAAGANDVRSVKGLTRCGMGYCQARVCGPVAQYAVARLTGRPLDAVGDLQARTIVTPVPLSRIAAATAFPNRAWPPCQESLPPPGTPPSA
jgi:thioredoxin reductase/bacterioferritin-associated ferredoxin